jgi:pyridoxine 4-dehydrogenase
MASEFLIGGDLRVRRLGLGTMRLTGSGVWGEPADRAVAKQVLRRALDLGINLVDTADSYGPAVSEQLIAEALYPYPAGLVIATKGGLTRGGPNSWTRNGSPEHLRSALEGSLRRLRVERIDVYQLHSPDPEVPFEESVGALADLRRAGKIRHVALSNVGVRQMDAARSIVPIVSVQNRYSVSDRSSEKVLTACEKANIGFIPWFPLATGELAKEDAVTGRIAREVNATPAQVALAWLLKRSAVMLPIPGTGSVQHLEENTAADAITLSDAQFASLSAWS